MHHVKKLWVHRPLNAVGVRWLVLVAATLLIGAGWLVSAPAARANGTPLQIKLTYLPDVSNFGPTDATGLAQIILVEGDVKLATRGLPTLQGDTYEGWVVDTVTGDRLSAGKFNPPPEGATPYTTIIKGMENKDFNLFVITVEPNPDPSPAPDSRTSIGGYFPLPEPLPTPNLLATPGSRPRSEGASTPGPGIPQNLPRTGQGPTSLVARDGHFPDRTRDGFAVTVLVGALSGAVLLGRSRQGGRK